MAKNTKNGNNGKIEEAVELIEESASEEAASIVEMARKVFQATLGVAVMAQEEVQSLFTDTESRMNKVMEDIGAFVDKLVEKGAIAEKDGRKLMNELVEKRRKQVEETTEKVTNVDERVKKVMDRFDIPTSSEIEKLTKKINTLSRKVDQLKKATEEAAEKPAAEQPTAA
jgi:poly(hydroxyalkanoate) granule-associated protein